MCSSDAPQIDLMLGEGKRVDAANALRHASQLFEVRADGEKIGMEERGCQS